GPFADARLLPRPGALHRQSRTRCFAVAQRRPGGARGAAGAAGQPGRRCHGLPRRRARRLPQRGRAMSRGMVDVAIAGGGVVGAAAALALAKLGLSVVLVEGRAPTPWSQARPDLRVFAFAHDNAALFDGIGAWAAIEGRGGVPTRLQPYRRMRVWDAGGGGELAFDADRLGRRELGWIVENALLVDRLWARLPGAGGSDGTGRAWRAPAPGRRPPRLGTDRAGRGRRRVHPAQACRHRGRRPRLWPVRRGRLRAHGTRPRGHGLAALPARRTPGLPAVRRWPLLDRVVDAHRRGRGGAGHGRCRFCRRAGPCLRPPP